MKVHQIQVGNMQNFTYIIEDDNTNEAIQRRNQEVQSELE